MLIAFAAILLGILECRVWAYWRWALLLAVWAVFWPDLFWAGGVPDNPQDDGILFAYVRGLIEDPRVLAWVQLAALLAYYAVIAFFIWRMVRAYRRHHRQRAQTDAEAPADGTGADRAAHTIENDAGQGRKAIEVAALCVVTFALIALNAGGLQTRMKDFAREFLGEERRSGPLPRGGLPIDVPQYVQDMAAAAQPELPRKIDEITTLEQVTADGLVLVFHHSLTEWRGSDAELIALLRMDSLPRACAQSDLRRLTDAHGVTLRHSYRLSGRAAPIDIDIDATACRKSGAAAVGVGPDPVSEYLETVAADERRTLPVQLDADTLWERVSVEGRTVVYHYRRDGEGAEVVASVRENNVPKVCADPYARGMIDKHGVTYRFSYVLPGSETPVTVDIDAETCRGR